MPLSRAVVSMMGSLQTGAFRSASPDSWKSVQAHWSRQPAGECRLLASQPLLRGAAGQGERLHTLWPQGSGYPYTPEAAESLGTNMLQRPQRLITGDLRSEAQASKGLTLCSASQACCGADHGHGQHEGCRAPGAAEGHGGYRIVTQCPHCPLHITFIPQKPVIVVLTTDLIACCRSRPWPA